MISDPTVCRSPDRPKPTFPLLCQNTTSFPTKAPVLCIVQGLSLFKSGAMKKIFLLGTFLTFTFSASAQYLPLLEDNKYWIYARYANDDIDPGVESAFMCTIRGDTLIAGILYRKVWAYELKGTHPCPLPYQPCFVPDFPYKTLDSTLIGFARENISQKKTYFLPILPNGFCQAEAHELFDFSLMPGDTLNDCHLEAIGAFQQPGFGIVDSISIAFQFGQYRRTLHTTGYTTYLGLPVPGAIHLSEGIGFDKYGLFHRAGNREELLDFCEGACNISSPVWEKPQPTYFSLYPNPASDNVTIESSRPIQQLVLKDVFGTPVANYTPSFHLDVSNLSPGIYIVEIYFSQKEKTVKRLLKI